MAATPLTIKRREDSVRIKLSPRAKLPPPEFFEADVSPLTKLNDQLTVGGITPKSKEYTLVTDPGTVVVQVITLKEAKEEAAREKGLVITELSETSSQLLDMLNNPQKYGFLQDTDTSMTFTQSQSQIVLAVFLLTGATDLDPENTSLTLEQKINYAKELLEDLKDAPTIQFTITPEAQAVREHAASLHQQATQEISPDTLSQSAKAFLNHIQTPFVPPPTVITPPPPPPIPVPPHLVGAARRKATQYAEAALKKFGGTIGNTVVNLKRGLQGRDAKSLAKAGAVIAGFLLGGPIGAGIVMALTSKKFQRLLAVLLAFVFSTFLTTIAVSFIVGSLIAAFVILIVQNSAYVVPPSIGIPVEPDSGLPGGGPGPGGPLGQGCEALVLNAYTIASALTPVPNPVPGAPRGFWNSWNHNSRYLIYWNQGFYERCPRPPYPGVEDPTPNCPGADWNYLYWCTWLTRHTYETAGFPFTQSLGAGGQLNWFKNQAGRSGDANTDANTIPSGSVIFFGDNIARHVAIILSISGNIVTIAESNGEMASPITGDKVSIGLNNTLVSKAGYPVIGFGFPPPECLQ